MGPLRVLPSCLAEAGKVAPQNRDEGLHPFVCNGGGALLREVVVTRIKCWLTSDGSLLPLLPEENLTH